MIKDIEREIDSHDRKNGCGGKLMTESLPGSLMPSDDDIQKLLAEVAKNNPMKLPETMIQIQFARLMAKQFEKLVVMWNKAADELDRKLSE